MSMSSNGLLAIPGMVSGLPTQSIINGLVAARKMAEVPLQSQQAMIGKQINAWDGVTPALTSFQSALQTLVNPSTWNQMTVNSTNSTAITATVANGSPAGTYSIVSNQLAQGQTSYSNQFSSTTNVGSAGDSFKITQGTKTATISLSGGESLSTLASSINTAATTAGVGVTASVVTSNGQSTLMVSSNQTGAANAFTMTDLSGTLVGTTLNMTTPPATQAQDAKATVNGIALTSSTNAFSNVVNGLSFTLNQAGAAQSTVSVTANTGAISTAVNNFMSAYNSIIGTLQSDTAIDTNNSANNGPLAGDPVLQGLMMNIQDIVTNLVPNTLPNGQPSAFKGLASIGIVVSSTGTMQFETASSTTGGTDGKTMFNNALASNLQDMQSLFGVVGVDNTKPTTGVAGALQSLITSATGTSGTVSSAESSLNDQNTMITKELAMMEQQSQLYQDQLNAQFNAMEVQISNFKAQGNWLNSMFGGTSSSSSSSSSGSGSSSSSGA